MGKYYNKGWTVPDTNALAFIIRGHTTDKPPLDKVTLHTFAVWVQMHRTYRTVKLMSGFPYASKYMDDIRDYEDKHPELLDFNVEALSDDEWDFICELPTEDGPCVFH